MFAAFVIAIVLVGVGDAILIARNESSMVTSSIYTTGTPTPPYPSGDPPEIFPSRITDIPAEDFDCWNSHLSWTSSTTSIDYADETEKTILTSYETTAQTYYGYYTELLPTWDTTLCDGYPRKTDRQTPTGWSPATSTGPTTTNTYYSTWLPPSPTCTVENFGTLCDRLYASETSIIDRISKAGYTTDWPLDDPTVMTSVLAPPCTTRSRDTTASISTPIPVTCSVDEYQLQYKVLYWPVEIAGNYSCAPANATVTHVTVTPAPTIPGRPNTAHYGDLVMTSPTIYYVLDRVQVRTFVDGTYTNPGRTGRWTDYGTAVDDITLSQDPRETAVSSVIGRCRRTGSHHGGHTECTTSAFPFAWEDLFTVPASLVVGRYGSLSTIYQGTYTPQYTYPASLVAEDEQWEVCDSMLGGTATPSYIALPTEKYKEWNEPWTWDGVIPPEQATPTPTVSSTVSNLGTSPSSYVPVMTTFLS